MYAEIIALVLSAAAGSYATYELVVRHLTAHFDLVLQGLEATKKEAADGIIVTTHCHLEQQQTLVKYEAERVKQIQTLVPVEVKRQIAAKLGVLNSDVCDTCKSYVVQFVATEDNRIKCINCQRMDDLTVQINAERTGRGQVAVAAYQRT
jgi:hypothetical protein